MRSLLVGAVERVRMLVGNAHPTGAVLVAMLGLAVVMVGPTPTQAADGAGPLLKLLQSGKLPAERQPTVLEMVCKRGNADDLAFVFTQVLDPQTLAPKLRLQTLDWLSDATKINKVKPAGDLSQIKQLLGEERAAKDPAFALAALRLATLWQAPGMAAELKRIAAAPSADASLRAAAIEGLTTFGDAGSRATLQTLSTAAYPTATRYQAIAALAGLDLPSAAQAAAQALAAASPSDDPTPMLQAFLTRRQGPEILATALTATKLSADVAKQSLRALYSGGNADPALADVLAKAAGIQADAAPPTGEALDRLASEVEAHGDPVRGESIFRRSDLNCMKCHSVSGGGGTIGPDLSPIGGTSPAVYVVASILDPDLAIKELYVTKSIVTSNGQVFSGIVVDRNDQEVKLKDAEGKILSVATADIEEEVVGKSLMPRGLTRFLTHQEFLDLAKFVAELGKPGPFSLRATPTVQRWRVMTTTPAEIAAETPNIEILRELVLAAPESAWTPVFAKVRGGLPLEELQKFAKDQVVILQGVIDVQEAGPVGLELRSTEPVEAWLDANSFNPRDKFTIDLAPGQHLLTIRARVSATPGAELRAEFFKPAGSSAQFVVR